jgi:hypothetical protein
MDAVLGRASSVSFTRPIRLDIDSRNVKAHMARKRARKEYVPIAYLLRRGAVYYIRRRIPPELRSFYGKKREVYLSLKTTDFREACSLRTIKAAEIERDFAERRALLTPPSGRLPRKIPPLQGA